MLLILMYHQIVNPTLGYGLAEFNQHLQYLINNFPIKVPGEPLTPNKLNVCLTFDDAYFDFYYYIYPILKELKLKAMLGIPTAFIPEENAVLDLTAKQRLAIPYPQAIDAHPIKHFATNKTNYTLTTEQKNYSPFGLCTWQELREMVASDTVIPASHSVTHANLADPNTDFEYELSFAKQTLEQKLTVPVDTFIYPYGKTCAQAQSYAQKHYNYNMRIGGALNKSWSPSNKLLYRVDADNFWPQNLPFSHSFLRLAKAKYYLNRLRNK